MVGPLDRSYGRTTTPCANVFPPTSLHSGISPSTLARYRQAVTKILQLLNLLHERGIRLLPGTDEPTGIALPRELEWYVEAGLSPGAVLRLATLGSAEYLGRDQDLGVIERGQLADFLLVAGDPTDTVSVTKYPRMVVKDGAIYFPSEIYREFGIEPFNVPPPWTLPKNLTI